VGGHRASARGRGARLSHQRRVADALSGTGDVGRQLRLGVAPDA
jgi:hypothetical protein